MKLWIRSQDKMNLVKIRQVGINYQNNKKIIANYIPDLYENSGEFVELLGTYKTKERALEVLDEIQNMLYAGLHATNNNQLAGTTSIVYQMPKE